jgi:putative Mg2+ transporter-C (MgtC) family protein
MIEAPDSLLETILRLAMAVAFAGAVGWDREVRNRPAGLRTHMLVSLGAAGFTIAGMQIIQSMPAGDAVSFDPMRLVGGLIGGIGFLGAGAIIQAGGEVRGLTTAAGLWTCAAIGLCAGAGLYVTASLITGFGLLVLIGMKTVENRYVNNDDDNA